MQLQIPRKSLTTGNEFSTHHVNSTNQPTNHRLPIGPSLLVPQIPPAVDRCRSLSSASPPWALLLLGHLHGLVTRDFQFGDITYSRNLRKQHPCLVNFNFAFKEKSPEKTQLPNFSHPKFDSNPWIPCFLWCPPRPPWLWEAHRSCRVVRSPWPNEPP